MLSLMKFDSFLLCSTTRNTQDIIDRLTQAMPWIAQKLQQENRTIIMIVAHIIWRLLYISENKDSERYRIAILLQEFAINTSTVLNDPDFRSVNLQWTLHMHSRSVMLVKESGWARTVPNRYSHSWRREIRAWLAHPSPSREIHRDRILHKLLYCQSWSSRWRITYEMPDPKFFIPVLFHERSIGYIRSSWTEHQVFRTHSHRSYQQGSERRIWNQHEH